MSPQRWVPVLLVIFGFIGGGLLLWQAPDLLSRILRDRPISSALSPEVNPEAVDALLAAALPAVRAVPLVEEERDGVRHGIYRLPPDTTPLDAANEIRTHAQIENIELYVSPVDGLDAEIRAYAGPALRQQLLLIPSLPKETRPPRVSTLRERPLIALIVAGLGAKRAPWLTAQTMPLTVAVRPYQPFSLRQARGAAQSWHEVLVDVRAHPESLRGSDALGKIMDAIPFCTGILSDTSPRVPLSDPFAVFVQPGARGSTPAFLRKHWVPAQRRQRRSAAETLSRTRLLAVQNGAAAIVLEADDEELPEILDWAAKEQGFRIALASEVLRADQVRGDTVARKPR